MGIPHSPSAHVRGGRRVKWDGGVGGGGGGRKDVCVSGGGGET